MPNFWGLELPLMLVILNVGSILGFDLNSIQNPFTEDFVEDPRLFTTPINATGVTDFFANNTLFLVGGVAIAAFILLEIALYALDVYYNQTYLGGNSFANKKDSYNNHLLQDHPSYRDPFLSTYRSDDSEHIQRILSWLSLLQDSWGS